jgi:ethanolamine ammonia-lyase small subunit
MASESDNSLVAQQWPELVRKIRERTPARLLVGRVGAAYRTGTQLELREAHAAARDAVRDELNLKSDFSPDFVQQWKLFEVCSQAQSKDEFLLRPDLGRHFSGPARVELAKHCSAGNDLQIAIGDGLSVAAVATQIPSLLPLLYEGAAVLGWTIGQTFVIRHCRVGVLNEIGEILTPNVAVLLIGERPGLATAESLSAYMAYRPEKSQTDADRNLISNIHARGVSTKDAATRILHLAAQMKNAQMSGCNLREELPALGKG